ncbi:hypothetical protein B0T24DRAFT_93362 [Lasiosphaeria ovina]|uniref:Monooxygenase n=1 Tax=Lasiosphaeria ovina TaxID=92902 RepID=A0AAE0NN52_9PEZI|nr:hypothetical protein B0T24DRAFT_93362 [Lasiosphaeria ovina]
MAPSSFTGIFSPRKERHHTTQNSITGLFKNSFSLSTLFAMGALGQTVLMLALPARYALLPTAALLLHAMASTALALRSGDTVLSDIVPGRTSAVLPRESYDPHSSDSDSNSNSNTPFPSRPGTTGVVVMHLGVRLNHPLGVLAPGAREMGEHFVACNARVLARAREFGCLGASPWRADTTLLTVYYFRTVEGLHAFARDPVHRAAWDWYNSSVAKRLGYTRIGIFHEIFYAAPGAHESVYVNMPPTLLGAASAVVRNNATGEDEWVSPLVKGASGSALRSMYSRMGREKEDAEPSS